MNECRDKRFSEMIHSYELGLLSEKDNQEFEMHLMDCEHCFNEVEQFQKIAHTMRTSSDVKDSIHSLVETQKRDKSVIVKSPSLFNPKSWPVLIKSSMIAISVLLFLVLIDWQFEIKTSHEVIASENRLAVIRFDNLSQDSTSNLSEIISNLLITDLSESRYVKVISSDRIKDIQQQLDQDNDESILTKNASLLAMEAKAQWMLIGNIIQVTPNIILTSEIIDVNNNEVVGSQRINGNNDEDIYSVIDRLTVAIKNDLSLPTAALNESDRPIGEKTTYSTVGYRHYLDGIDLYNKYYKGDAIESFKKAINIDSTFALAYYYLAVIPGQQDRMAMIEKAIQYSDKVSQREKLWIINQKNLLNRDIDQYVEGLKNIIDKYPNEHEAYYLLASYLYNKKLWDEANEKLKLAITIDPLYKKAFNLLAYSYYNQDNLDSAILYINRYIDIAPNEANPFDSRGDIYVGFGMIKEAIESYSMALKIKPDFRASLSKLSGISLLDNNIRLADSCYKILVLTGQNETQRAYSRFALSFVPVHQGQFSKAIQIIEDCIAADRIGGMEAEFVYRYRMMALVYAAQNNYETALENIETCLTMPTKYYPDNKDGLSALKVSYLVKLGRYQEADNIIDDLMTNNDTTASHFYASGYALGSYYLENGKPDSAVIVLERVVTKAGVFPIKYLLARAYLADEQYENAISAFENQIASLENWRLCWGSWNVEMHYYLGLAYEKTNRFEEAIAQHEIMLNIWKEADTGNEMIADATKKIIILKNKI